MRVVLRCPQKAPDQFVERHGLGTGDFDRAVDRRCQRDIGERRHHVVGRDRLDQRRRQANLLADGGRLGNAADKLEELRGTQDGVGNAGRLDEVFLRDLGPEIAVLGKPFATDDRQGNVMANAGGSFGSQQVTARRFEEIEDGLVFPRRRVRHVDDDIGAIHRFGQALAGDAVHARAGRGGEHVMAALAEVLHKFRSDEAGASDDDDLHGLLSASRRQPLLSMWREIACALEGSPCADLEFAFRKAWFFVQRAVVRPASHADGAAGYALPYYRHHVPIASSDTESRALDQGMLTLPFVFEDYVLDQERRELTLRGQVVAVGPQVFDLLLQLVSNRDRVVSKDDLLKAVWSGRIVSESTITSHINAVRKAIGDTGEEQRLVRTVARKGYRFVGEIKVGEIGEARQPGASDGRANTPPANRGNRPPRSSFRTNPPLPSCPSTT